MCPGALQQSHGSPRVSVTKRCRSRGFLHFMVYALQLVVGQMELSLLLNEEEGSSGRLRRGDSPRLTAIVLEAVFARPWS
jgi:hypothetical protein